jgi:hypothetical protein
MKNLTLTKILLLSSAAVIGGTATTFAPAWSSDLAEKYEDAIGKEEEALVAPSTASTPIAVSEETSIKKKVQKPKYFLGILPWGTEEVETEDETPVATSVSLVVSTPQPSTDPTDPPKDEEATPASAVSAETTEVIETLPASKTETKPALTGWFGGLFSWANKNASAPATISQNAVLDIPAEPPASNADLTEPSTPVNTPADTTVDTAHAEDLGATPNEKGQIKSKDISRLTLADLKTYQERKTREARATGKSLADIPVGDSIFLTQEALSAHLASGNEKGLSYSPNWADSYTGELPEELKGESGNTADKALEDTQDRIISKGLAALVPQAAEIENMKTPHDSSNTSNKAIFKKSRTPIKLTKTKTLTTLAGMATALKKQN